MCAYISVHICVLESVGGDNGEREQQMPYVCVFVCVEKTQRPRKRERESVCVGGKDSASEGKNDWGLKVLRLRVLGLRSEDIIVMFCFH